MEWESFEGAVALLKRLEITPLQVKLLESLLLGVVYDDNYEKKIYELGQEIAQFLYDCNHQNSTLDEQVEDPLNPRNWAKQND